MASFSSQGIETSLPSFVRSKKGNQPSGVRVQASQPKMQQNFSQISPNGFGEGSPTPPRQIIGLIATYQFPLLLRVSRLAFCPIGP